MARAPAPNLNDDGFMATSDPVVLDGAGLRGLVDELRARYESDPDAYLADYLDALDQLATARWQAGDWWGSRAPSKEAKALRKQHGL